jgi:hypothetical protein
MKIRKNNLPGRVAMGAGVLLLSVLLVNCAAPPIKTDAPNTQPGAAATDPLPVVVNVDMIEVKASAGISGALIQVTPQTKDLIARAMQTRLGAGKAGKPARVTATVNVVQGGFGSLQHHRTGTVTFSTQIPGRAPIESLPVAGEITNPVVVTGYDALNVGATCISGLSSILLLVTLLQGWTIGLIPALGLLTCACGIGCAGVAIEQWVGPSIQSGNLSDLIVKAATEHADDIVKKLGLPPNADGEAPKSESEDEALPTDEAAPPPLPTSEKTTPNAAQEPQWFVGIDEEREGPYHKAHLQKLAIEGKITRETLVWKKGMGEWQKMGEVEELSDVIFP